MARYDFTTPRLFVESPLAPDRDVALGRTQVNYLRNVLRLPLGADVLAFNGCDGEWRTTLATHGKDASLRTGEQTRPQPPAPDLIYGFAPLKHARLDYMVQKAVEMGAGVLQPIGTQHTQVTRLNRDRMQANAIEAAEQCGVLHVPEARDIMRLDRFAAAQERERLLVFCDEDAAVADPVAVLRAAVPDGGPVPLALLVGPEGGFDSRERALLAAHPRVARLSLGPRILRADTAAVAALAVVQAVLGDWRGSV